MAKIISLINQKGGCGKTTSCYNLAAAFAEKGCRVLMIDNDPQGSLTLYCGFDPAAFEHTVDQLYLGKAKASDAVYSTKIGNLFLIPANIRLSKIEAALGELGEEGWNYLQKAMSPVSDTFDFLFIDDPPSLSMLMMNSLFCSDFALIPCQASPLCTLGLDTLFETLERTRPLMPNLKVLGILATIYRKAVKIFREELEQMEENYTVLGVIKESADIIKSVSLGLPVIKYNRNSEVSRQYLAAAEEILGMVEGKIQR